MIALVVCVLSPYTDVAVLWVVARGKETGVKKALHLVVQGHATLISIDISFDARN